MKPLFTIHAGEYLVGSYIEKHFKNYLVWIPSRDSGVDLLITDKHCQKSVGVQVKFSKDFLSIQADALQPTLRTCCWFKLQREKISTSRADFWIFVLHRLNQNEQDFVIIRPAELLARLTRIHGSQQTFQSYMWVTEKPRCWETRGLSYRDQLLMANNQYDNASRDLTRYLNNWEPIRKRL